MNTKLLMASSAVFLGTIGVLASFFPQEILALAGLKETRISILLIQIMAALYMAFGMLNWMGKGNIIGGIYYRPVAMGNVIHFGVGSIALIKAALAMPADTWLWIATIPYSLFAVLFAKVFFTHPAKKSE